MQRNLGFISFILVLIMMSSCQQKAFFGHSMIVPIAYGNITMDEVEEDTYLLEIEVNLLTEPSNIDPSKKYYAAWAVSRRDTQRIGLLNHQEITEEASVLGEVEMREVDEVVITAESHSNVAEMSEFIVLRSERF